MKIGQYDIHTFGEFWNAVKEIQKKDWREAGKIRKAYLMSPFPYIFMLLIFILTLVVSGSILIAVGLGYLFVGIRALLSHPAFWGAMAAVIAVFLYLLVIKH